MICNLQPDLKILDSNTKFVNCKKTMKSGFLILEGPGPLTPLPLPPSNQMLAIDLLVEMYNMSGLDLYPRWFPGNHTSSIRHPSFLLSTISLPVFLPPFV